MAAYDLTANGRIFVFTSVGNVTTGFINVAIYDDSSTIIGAKKVVTWTIPTDPTDAFTMSIATIADSGIFDVPAGTIVSSMALWTTVETTYPMMTNNFEQQYTYTNAGTFTITDITITVV